MLQLFSEFVQTTSRYQLNDPLDATDNTNATMKLKVISLISEVNSRHSRNWRKDGQFKEKFRTPYTKQEDLSIISFIKRRKGAKNTNATMKLKVISLISEVNSRHSRNWRKDGQFKEKFRTPYTKQEDLSIISFIKRRKGAKNEIGGNRV